MTRPIKIISLAIGLGALAFLTLFGFAIWVFLPIMPAGVIFAIAVLAGRRRPIEPIEPPATAATTTVAEPAPRKAA